MLLLGIDIEKAWKDPKSFLTATSENIQSSADWNQLITNHLWIYQRYAIRNALNITRFVPPDEDREVQVNAGKVRKLMKIHAEIMKTICPLASNSYFDAIVGTFMSVLTKGIRWKEPYLEQTHYLRILASLTTCKNNAETMQFVGENEDQCTLKVSSFFPISCYSYF